ncbi:MAG: polyprenyl synthetase family protein, partial [Deltaproteobacteria bacterium]
MVEEALGRFLPREGCIPSRLPEAMRYSVFSGGKRIRPLLVLASCYAVGGDPQRALPFACALEMIHTYSLIHDDLPSMDDDDYRRGRATSHRVFGEALAILAGDALLTDAFGLMSSPGAREGISPEVALSVIHEVARAVGSEGMVGGQAVDVEVEGKEVDGGLIQWIHERKTAAFIMAAVKIGGMLGGAEE